MADMKGDFTEWTFAKKRYGGVRLEQGRVELDADWDERLDVRIDKDTVYLDVWNREVEQTEDESIGVAAAGGPDTNPRQNKPKTDEWRLRLTHEVAKPGGAASEAQFALGRVDFGSSRPLVLPESEVSVDGVPWRRVGSLSGAGPGDKVYVVKQDGNDGGSSCIEFGDGKNGARPATGAQISASYRLGHGSGNVPGAGTNRAENRIRKGL